MGGRDGEREGGERPAQCVCTGGKARRLDRPKAGDRPFVPFGDSVHCTTYPFLPSSSSFFPGDTQKGGRIEEEEEEIFRRPPFPSWIVLAWPPRALVMCTRTVFPHNLPFPSFFIFFSRERVPGGCTYGTMAEKV